MKFESTLLPSPMWGYLQANGGTALGAVDEDVKQIKKGLVHSSFLLIENFRACEEIYLKLATNNYACDSFLSVTNS